MISVYNTSTKTSVSFSVSCYFPNGKRWINFPTPTPHTRISIMGRIFGVTSPQQLAIALNDIFFLPTSTHVPHTPLTQSSTDNRATKRRNRWTSRATSATPSKKPRLSKHSPEPLPDSESYIQEKLEPAQTQKIPASESTLISDDTSSVYTPCPSSPTAITGPNSVTISTSSPLPETSTRELRTRRPKKL